MYYNLDSLSVDLSKVLRWISYISLNHFFYL